MNKTTVLEPGYYWVKDRGNPHLSIMEWSPECGQRGMWSATGIDGGFEPDGIEVCSGRLEAPRAEFDKDRHLAPQERILPTIPPILWDYWRRTPWEDLRALAQASLSPQGYAEWLKRADVIERRGHAP